MPVEEVARDRRAARAPGRQPGLAPPLPAWAPLVWLVVGAAVLAVVVIALVRPPGPLDDADPAYQRDGLLLDGPVVPAEVAGVVFGGRPVVLLFERQVPDAAALSAWAREVPAGADTYLVLPEPPDGGARLPTVVDPLDALTGAVGMPRPVDGGRPVGYAVVDSDRVVRYATIDPDYLGNAFEVDTVVGAVR